MPDAARDSSPGTKSTLRRYAEALALAILVAFLIRGLALRAFRVTSTSMTPTLLVGDHVLVSKLRYGIPQFWGDGWLLACARPRVGDVIVFVPPADREVPRSAPGEFVKRVVAVEGEVVEIRNGRLVVNGKSRGSRREYYSRSGVGKQAPSEFGPLRLEEGQFFVLGDNRSHSRDSREWGPVDMSAIEGKVLFIYWSWDNREQRVLWERIGKSVE